MILVTLLFAFGPLAWPIYALIRWRSRSVRPLLLGGLTFGGAAMVLVVVGAILKTIAWGTAGGDLGSILVYLGWFWGPQGLAMIIAGGVVHLAFARAE